MELELLPGTDRVERIRFNGIVYRRYPQSKRHSDRMYFRAGIGDCIQGKSRLHTDVWRFYRGEIPDGYEVDHIDGNTSNNSISNLQLLSIAEHKAKHAEDSARRGRMLWDQRSPECKKRMHDSAAEWHRSEEGRQWHSEHAKRCAALVPMCTKRCEICDKEYAVKKTMFSWSRFCGINCKSEARRRSGVDDVDRQCVCGAIFRVNKYAARKFCHSGCSQKRSSSRKCSRVQSDG